MSRSKHKKRQTRATETRFNFGEVNPKLYDPAKGWFEPDKKTRDALEQAALADIGKGHLPALMKEAA